MGPSTQDEMADQGEPARVLLISRLYPSDAALYKYPFVHRRVLEYRRRGVLVDVVRPKLNRPSSTHEFEGVSCRTPVQWRPGRRTSHGWPPRHRRSRTG